MARTLRSVLFDELVISTSSSKDIALLAIEQALEENTTRVKLFIEAAERVNIDFAFDVPMFRVVDNGRQVGKDSMRSIEIS